MLMDGALGGTNDSSCVNGSPLRFQFHEPTASPANTVDDQPLLLRSRRAVDGPFKTGALPISCS
jgi:hypothetical protein